MRAPLLCLLVLLPGCFSPGESAPPQEPDSVDDALRECPCPGEEPVRGVPAPDLPAGRAWTYAGASRYNPDAEWTVVVAEATPEGYHFAGGAEDDVAYDALWGSAWFGPHARDLSEGTHWKAIEWPLEDGKTWTVFGEIAVKARAAEVATPRGREPGFVIEGGSGAVAMRYEYAPSVGNLVRYLVEVDGEAFEQFELTAVRDGVASWVWYEPGPLAVAADPREPAVFDVAAGFDALLVSAGGRGGGRALVAPPGATQPWSDAFAGDEAWRHAVLPPTEGKWIASVQGRPWIEGAPEAPADLGWAYVHALPVRWLRSA